MKNNLRTAVRVAAVLALAALMALSLLTLTACRGDGQGSDTTPAVTTDPQPGTSDPADTSDSAGSSDTSDSTGDSGTTAPGEGFTLARGEATEYVVVIGKNASSAEAEAADKLVKAFNQYLGVKLGQTIDLVNEKLGYVERATEIVVGKTTRDMGGVWDADSHRRGDYFIGVSGQKLFITGASDAALGIAMDKFINKFLVGVSDNLTLTSKDNIDFAAAYELRSFTREGSEVGAASVAVKTSNAFTKEVSNAFATRLSSAYGYSAWASSSGKADILLTTVDESPEHAALLGENAAAFGLSGGQIVLVGRTAGDLYAAANDLGTSLGVIGSLALTEGKAVYVYNPTRTVRVMSFNIASTFDMDKRRSAVTWVIATNAPDVFGIQEGKDAWLTYFASCLDGVYDVVGRGTNEAGYTDTYDNIYYRRDRFTLKDGGTIWLSDTPDVAGSKFSESKRVRIATYAQLTDRETGGEMLFVNTHLDNASQSARAKQADVLLSFLAKYDCPISVTGDFNSNMSNEVYTKMTGLLCDSRTDAADRRIAMTFNNYGSGSGSILDYVYLSRDVNIHSYLVFTSLYGGTVYPSDHNALVVEFEVKG